MYQLLAGLAHAHARCVLHRDVKPANVLIDPASGLVKLADWGLARSATPPLRAYTQEARPARAAWRAAPSGRAVHTGQGGARVLGNLATWPCHTTMDSRKLATP